MVNELTAEGLEEREVSGFTFAFGPLENSIRRGNLLRLTV